MFDREKTNRNIINIDLWLQLSLIFFFDSQNSVETDRDPLAIYNPLFRKLSLALFGYTLIALRYWHAAAVFYNVLICCNKCFVNEEVNSYVAMFKIIH